MDDIIFNNNHLVFYKGFLGIVDTFDAMTNDRPYRKALPAGTAIHEINNCSGTQFDSELVNLFDELINLYLYNKEG